MSKSGKIPTKIKNKKINTETTHFTKELSSPTMQIHLTKKTLASLVGIQVLDPIFYFHKDIVNKPTTHEKTSNLDKLYNYAP